MDALKTLNTLIEPVIITYNRASILKQTLISLFNTAFFHLNLHILDNRSTDETAIIVREMQTQWPSLHYHRNDYNIGGNANMLRAIERSKTPYAWILGDDDHYTIKSKYLEELAMILREKKVDIVRLGWLVPDEHQAKLDCSKHLIQSEQLFFFSFSLISSVIMKRSLVNRYLPQAYHHIAYFYPQLVPIFLSLENQQDLKIYSLSEKIVTHTPSTLPGYFRGDLEWYACWFRSAQLLTTKTLKKKCIKEIVHYTCQYHPHKSNDLLFFVKMLAYHKSFGCSQLKYLLNMLIDGSGYRFKLCLLLVVYGIISCLPIKLLAYLRTFFPSVAKKTLQANRTRL